MTIIPINENVIPINQEEFERQNRVKIWNDSVIKEKRWQAAVAAIGSVYSKDDPKVLAERAFRVADAMLKAGGYLDETSSQD